MRRRRLRSGLIAAGVICSAMGRPDAARTPADRFTTSEQCAVCHSVAPGASAMRSATGDDVSPYGLWQGTMMANAFRDPYFRAQLAKETAAAGPQVQELCLRCHAPMAWHERVLAGEPPPRLADLEGDIVADDGVSCTVCHSIAAQDLGLASTFSGQPRFDAERRLFGPFAEVATGPMLAQVRYTPTHGPHVQRSALCGSCHTLITEHHGTPFLEQSPYLEWQNSEFNDEHGATATSRSCQQCHMARTGATRIARSPMGQDYGIPVRDGYAAHAFVGGNAFVLDLLAEHREELDVLAEPEALARMAAATRRQLAEDTARLSITPIARDDGQATFAVQVENLTGHKFPTGYPARRAWLHVELYDGERLLFASGAHDAQGRLVDVPREHGLPHVATVTQPGDVVVYELVATDADAAPTTHLTRMVGKQKDNRLLPRGWRADGPHAADIAPVGTDGDADFAAGGDRVAFRIALPERVRGRLRVQATLLYQAVPPHWVDALRAVEDEAAQRFVQMYDAAEKVPETVAVASRRER